MRQIMGPAHQRKRSKRVLRSASRWRRLHCESLEDRLLLSVSPLSLDTQATPAAIAPATGGEIAVLSRGPALPQLDLPPDSSAALSAGASGVGPSGLDAVGSISGVVFNDRNGNGAQGAGEPGLAGWTVYLDSNGNGSLDVSSSLATPSSTDVPKAINDFATVASALPVSGLSGTVADVNVTLDITHTYDADLTVTLIGPGGTRVQLFSGVGVSGDNFSATTLDDQAATSIDFASAPFSGTYAPSSPLSVLNGGTPNGTWQLEVTDGFGGDIGTLNSWSLALTTAVPTEPFVVTPVGGSYSFTGLAAGSYAVRQVDQAGWLQTAPVSVYYSETLPDGGNLTGRDFGDRLPPGEIHGQKWNDVNQNHVKESGEAGLDGWTIELVDQATSTVVATQVTAGGGYYDFTNLPPANYEVREAAQPGWVQTFPGTVGLGTPSVNVAGGGFSGVYPPDANGDVGLNHYVQAINQSSSAKISVYAKASGALVESFTMSALGGPAGGGDPIVLYDALADRWLLAEFADTGNTMIVHISKTGTPNSDAANWYTYTFAMPEFPDYPKFSVWPDGYFLTTNNDTGSEVPVYALDRTNMLAGLTPRTMQRFTAPDGALSGFGFQALTPADLDGQAPPAGASALFMRHRDTEVHITPSPPPGQDLLQLYQVHVDFDTPANSSISGPVDIAVADFDSNLNGLSAFEAFPQPGTTTKLDPLREVIMQRLQYRNFGTYETLVGNFVTDVDGTDHGGVRWFELRRSGGGAWTLYQEGTYAPDADSRWMGGISMDGAGNIVLGYNVSSSTVYPSIRYVGRLASDPLGTLPRGEYPLVSGLSSQAGINRWGDYNSMSVDPVDDRTFWFTGEYMGASGRWATQIGALAIGAANGTGVHSITLNSGAVIADAYFGGFQNGSSVVGRHVFYNNSAFDGNNAAANASDDNAVAPDKTPLLPGGTATFANYTSYVRGINGIIIDIGYLPAQLTAADFEFRTGNDSTPAAWSLATAPTVSIRMGAGALLPDGVTHADRVTLTWNDYYVLQAGVWVLNSGGIGQKWLQVTIKANANTGLSQSDVFYFGNAIGETGDSASNAAVNIVDFGGARDNPHNAFNRAPIDNPYDFDRDQFVNVIELGLVRDNSTNAFNDLNLITVPASAGATDRAPGGTPAGVDSTGGLSALGEGPTLPAESKAEIATQTPAPAARDAAILTDGPQKPVVDSIVVAIETPAAPQPLAAEPSLRAGTDSADPLVDLVTPAWVEQGPRPMRSGQLNVPPNHLATGAIESIAVNPWNPAQIYVGTVNGGVWRTDNADPANPDATVWTALTDQMGSLAMGDIAFSPLDPTGNTLFAGTGSYSSLSALGGPAIGTLRTTDGGASWTNFPLPSTQYKIKTILPTAIDLDAGPGVQELVLVGTIGGGGLYRSNNNGQSYTLLSGANGLPTGNIYQLVVDPNNSQRFYVGIANTGVYRGDFDAGTSVITWTACNTGLNGISGSGNVQVAATNVGGTTAVYALLSGTNYGAYRSIDGGATWTTLTTPPTNFNLNSFLTQGSSTMLADPVNDTVYIAAPYNGSPDIFRYNPSGSGSWVAIDYSGASGNTYPHMDARDLAFQGANTLVESCDGGIYFLQNPTNATANAWHSYIGDNGTGVGAVEFHDVAWDSISNVVVGGSQDNGTEVQISTGSNVWRRFSSGDGGDVVIDTTTLAATNQSIRYYSSQNLGGFSRRIVSAANVDGASTSLIPTGGLAGFVGQFVTPVEINALPGAVGKSQRIVIGGGTDTTYTTGAVYEADNAGVAASASAVNWVQVPVQASSGFTSVSALAYGGSSGGIDNPDVLYVGTNNKVFVRTTAGGTLAPTATQFPGSNVRDIALDPSDWRHAIVISSSGVWETTNTGATWTARTGNLGNSDLRTVEYVSLGGPGVVVVGGRGGAFRMTTNSPGVWAAFGSSLPKVLVYDLEYNVADDVLLAGTLGRGAWTIPNASTYLRVPSSIVSRNVFYNNSAFDGNDPAANANDDSAIATDKTPLLPGGTATFANYTSYVRGINGIIVDIGYLPAQLTAADFEFRTGNDNTPSAWALATAPTVSIRWGAGPLLPDGVTHADRVTLTWNDYYVLQAGVWVLNSGGIGQKWLQVTVKATANTGLGQDDVFYFGNAIGDSGDSATSAAVNIVDFGGARDNPHNAFNRAAITDAYDFDRDQFVNVIELGLVRDNSTNAFNDLNLISVPASPNPADTASGGASRVSVPLAATVDVSGDADTAVAAATPPVKVGLAARDAALAAILQWCDGGTEDEILTIGKTNGLAVPSLAKGSPRRR